MMRSDKLPQDFSTPYQRITSCMAQRRHKGSVPSKERRWRMESFESERMDKEREGASGGVPLLGRRSAPGASAHITFMCWPLCGGNSHPLSASSAAAAASVVA